MKRIIGIVILLVVVVLSGYFCTGLITERTLKKNLNALNQANGFSAELVSYHRGLFKSTADLTWRTQMPEKIIQKDDGASVVVPPKVYSFDMPLVIYHGPVMFGGGRVRFGLGAAHGDLNLSDAYATEFAEKFSPKSTKPRLGVDLFVTYLNKTHLELSLPAFELINKNGESEFQWLGMLSDLRFSPESTRLQGHFMLDGLRFMKQKFRLILNKVTSSYDVHKTENGLFLGEAKLSVPVLQVTDEQKTEFEVKQFEVSSKSTLEKGLFASSFHAAFSNLVSRDGHQYGPGEFDIAVKNLDGGVLADVNQRINQLHHFDTKGGQAQQLLISLLPELPKLLGKGAIFEIGAFKLGLPEGAIDGAVRIAFPDSGLDSPLQALPKIQGDGHLSMPAPFLKSMLVHSYKQQLLRAQEMAEQEKQEQKTLNQKPVEPVNPDAKSDVAKNDNVAPPVTIAELDQQAVQKADQKIEELIRLGALQAKGTDYLLELKLASGRLLVNGHPFHSGMLSF